MTTCGWGREAGHVDASPCDKDTGHLDPHRLHSPYFDGSWIEYDVTTGAETARGGPLFDKAKKEGAKAVTGIADTIAAKKEAGAQQYTNWHIVDELGGLLACVCGGCGTLVADTAVHDHWHSMTRSVV